MLSMSCTRPCSLCRSVRSLSFSFSLLLTSTWKKAKQRFKHTTEANPFSHSDLEDFSHPHHTTFEHINLNSTWRAVELSCCPNTHEWAPLLHLVTCQTWDKKIWTQRSAYLLLKHVTVLISECRRLRCQLMPKTTFYPRWDPLVSNRSL